MRLYPDGEFDTPLVDESTVETTASFDEGRFEEGKFYWHVVAEDASGKELATGRMNSLQIAFDNAVIDLAIKGPGHGELIRGSSVVTHGEVQLGARLSINGNRISLDNKGRFRQSIPLERGTNQIVYQTSTPDGVERYYILQVQRR